MTIRRAIDIIVGPDHCPFEPCAPHATTALERDSSRRFWASDDIPAHMLARYERESYDIGEDGR